MADPWTATQIGKGVYRVEYAGRNELVYVAGGRGDRWAFWNGQVFHTAIAGPAPSHSSLPRRQSAQALTAPMPATVSKVLVRPGTAVKNGDTVVILEAMKMELPIRAPADAVVVAVHCHEGDQVQPDTTLVDLE